jgi:hypothetical protein
LLFRSEGVDDLLHGEDHVHPQLRIDGVVHDTDETRGQCPASQRPPTFANILMMVIKLYNQIINKVSREQFTLGESYSGDDLTHLSRYLQSLPFWHRLFVKVLQQVFYVLDL